MNALELTTAANTFAVAIAAGLSNEDLKLTTALLSQITSVLAVILVQRGGTDETDELSPVVVSSTTQGRVVSSPLG